MAKNLLQNSADLAAATSSSGTAAVVTPHPLVLVQQQVLSGSNSTTFTNLANYPYKNYKLTFRGNSTSSSNINIQISTNNGTSYVGTNYQSSANYLAYQGTTFSATQYLNVGFILHPNLPGSSIAIDVNLYNIGYSPANYTSCLGLSTSYNGSAAVYYNIITGIYTGSSLINAFIINGNTITGTFNLYGYSS